MNIYRALWTVVGTDLKVGKEVEVHTKSGKTKTEKVVAVYKLENGLLAGITERGLAQIQAL